MAAGVFGERSYSKDVVPWHRIGTVSEIDQCAVDAFNSMGGVYQLEKRPTMVFLNGSLQEIKDFAIVRSAVPDDPSEKVFGYVTDDYNIIQPMRLCELFDEKVNAPVETLGMLGQGERLFLTWKLPQSAIREDTIDNYGFVAMGYDGKMGASLNVVKTRVVCQNTFSAAIIEAQNNKEEGKGRLWAGKHNSPNIERDLGLWLEHVQEQALAGSDRIDALFNKLARVPVEEPSLADLLFRIYPNPEPASSFMPQKLKEEKQERIKLATEKANRDRETVARLFNGEGTAIDATAWGLFNATTEYENHVRATKKPAEASILFGNRANTMRHAANVLNYYADSYLEKKA